MLGVHVCALENSSVGENSSCPTCQSICFQSRFLLRNAKVIESQKQLSLFFIQRGGFPIYHRIYVAKGYFLALFS